MTTLATTRRLPHRGAHSSGTRALARARVALLAAVLVAGALVVFEVPFSEVVHQQGELASVRQQLTATDQANARLSATVSGLRKPATVAAIAHEDYGLVEPGQLAYVVLPATGSGDALGTAKIPTDDLVPAALSPYAPLAASSAHRPSLWRRVLDRLEFWHS